MRSPRLILALCLMTGLAACHRGESADNSPPPTNKQLIENGDADVAKVCASDETLDGLKAVVMNSVDAAKATPAYSSAVESSAAASDPSVDPDATGDTSIRGSKPAN